MLEIKESIADLNKEIEIYAKKRMEENINSKRRAKEVLEKEINQATNGNNIIVTKASKLKTMYKNI